MTTTAPPGLRERKNVDLIACPSCGRAEVDVIDVANRAMAAFADREITFLELPDRGYG